jgi:hypothetical protein
MLWASIMAWVYASVGINTAVFLYSATVPVILCVGALIVLTPAYVGCMLLHGFLSTQGLVLRLDIVRPREKTSEGRGRTARLVVATVPELTPYAPPMATHHRRRRSRNARWVLLSMGLSAHRRG